MKNSTRCVSLDTDDQYGSVSPPIFQTATFRQPSADEFGEYDYSRSGNPTRTQVEKKIAALEHGEYAAAFGSGMAAITSVCRLLESGDEILASEDLYGGSIRLLEKVLPRQGISVRYVDTSDIAAVQTLISAKTKLLLVETPTNPFLRISDIRALSELAASRSIIVAVDNSMLSPCLQNPLDLGADIVLHSATKFLCGHSDVTGGAVVTNSEDIYRQIAFVQNAEGTALSPFESWLLLRGIKTLALRVERQSDSAQKVAEFLAAHNSVENVYYPTLAGHYGRETHLRQASSGGSVISFATGDKDLSRRFVEATELAAIAVSFGSVNTTISLPFHMSHASIPAELKETRSPRADLIRLSVGIEDVDDIIADLEQAFESAVSTGISQSTRAVAVRA